MKIYNVRVQNNHDKRIYQERYNKVYVMDNYGSTHLLGGNLLLGCLRAESMLNTERIIGKKYYL